MKRKCVLGVLKTELGLKIKEEMLAWLSPLYDVITVEQEAPGELFEYPGIRMAASIAAETYESVLYLHTKGAFYQNPTQPHVREYWRQEFVEKADAYFAPCEVNKDDAVVTAPVVAKNNKVCWFNGFVMSPGAAKKLNKVISIKKDRMWFEQDMWGSCENVKVVGILRDDAETPEQAFDAFCRVYGKKVGLVALAKNETRYLKEWVEYHHNLGIDQFFIIDNNDIGDNSQRELLESLPKEYGITIVNLQGKDALQKAGLQEGIYNYVMQQLIRQRTHLDWVTFIDIDEFLYFNGKTVKEFLYQDKFKMTDVIHLNWRLYDDNDQIHYEDKPVLERFTRQAPLNVVYNDEEKQITENCFIKSFFHITNKRFRVSPHTVYVENGVCKRGDGTLTDCRRSAEPLTSDDNYVKHFNCKSLEEYIDRRCLYTLNICDLTTGVPADKRIRWYFNENKRTPEKIEYIKQKLPNCLY